MVTKYKNFILVLKIFNNPKVFVGDVL